MGLSVKLYLLPGSFAHVFKILTALPLISQKLMLQPALVATKVVCLTHAVSSDELKDDEDYEEILDDMRQECSKFGNF